MVIHQISRDRPSHGRICRRSYGHASVSPDSTTILRDPSLTSKFRFFAYDSPAAAQDLNLADTKTYGGPNHISAGIQHGSWSIQTKPGRGPNPSFVSSSQPSAVREDLKYTSADIAAVEEWVKRHVETTWHSLGTCSMAPREGNSIVKHGVLDERLNVHGVKGLKCADLSICPDNVGCNTYSTALLIGEKAAMLVAEDLGYSGEALQMKVPVWKNDGQMARL